MSSKHLSVRLGTDTFDRLDRESRLAGQTRSQLAKSLLEEGLRMHQHPGIVFRGGPAGRRPALYEGPDVWEVARVFLNIDADGQELINRTAELTALHPERVRAAMSYYAEFSDEIQQWIRLVEEAETEAEESWRREKGLLHT